MKVIIAILLFFILISVCWPLALVMFIFLPFILLLSLFFKAFGLLLTAFVGFIFAILAIPFKLVGLA
ncbi:MAG: hypothetical protein KI791_14540 [Cyclobacteriaceae bacterium]|nr:hypothetical protein [Cyclobacteriaceae bacterium SS2]